MEKMTIHRALSELKLIGAKIEKAIENCKPSGIQQKDKLVDGRYELESFKKDALASYQSVIDLIARRNKIKSAIVDANSRTMVKVADEEMTIAEAINFKYEIELKKSFIKSIDAKHKSVLAQMERNNAKVEENAQQLASVALGKQGVKIGDNDAQAVIAPFMDANRYNLIDPVEVEKKVKELSDKVSSFEAEVDAVLSEINAITVIAI